MGNRKHWKGERQEGPDLIPDDPTLYMPSQVSEEVNQELAHSGESVVLRWDQKLHKEGRVGPIHSLCSSSL